MAVQAFFLLLLVTKSMASWDSNSEISLKSPGHARAVPTRCNGTQMGVFCSTCQEAYLCTPDATPTVITCPSHQLCTGDPGRAGCLNFTGGANAGDCDCDNIGNVGFLADPYDSTKYFICIQPEGQFPVTCDDGLAFNSETNTCEAEIGTGDEIIQTDSNVDCSTNSIGFYTNDPTCETYTVCYSSVLPGILGRCSTGQAFDTSVSTCVTQCSLAPPAFACPEGGSGAFPDTSDCSVFHVCSMGNIFVSNSQCPNGELFEPTSMACVSSSSNVDCPVINNCWAAYCDACGGVCPDTTPTGSNTTITTIDPPSSSPTTTITTTVVVDSDTVNCNNNPGYFQYPADCKQFWSCQDDDVGGYEAILYRCPGSLYFIPSLEYCSLQSDLPTNPGCTIVP